MVNLLFRLCVIVGLIGISVRLDMVLRKLDQCTIIPPVKQMPNELPTPKLKYWERWTC